MLVLSRRVGEEIVIGEGVDAIVLTVVEIRGPRVRLGIKAPQQVKVNRREIHDKILRNLEHQEQEAKAS